MSYFRTCDRATPYLLPPSVDTDTMLVLGIGMTQAGNDKQQLAPMLDTLAQLPQDLGSVTTLLVPYWPTPVTTARRTSTPVSRRASSRYWPQGATRIIYRGKSG